MLHFKTAIEAILSLAPQLVVTLAIALATNRWTVFHHCFIWGSLIAWWIFVFYMYGLPMMIWEFESFYGMEQSM
jgi:hypothetical protein